ncbi:unnamed protein product [Lactuca virosa]|uniref:Uncharacterized protein n=1 Tax=Lactuca virosa TaxID=75947 RepID=A0AAU9NZL8_9ASTR|nr:unnamed protein product [Lactuca virosa]
MATTLVLGYGKMMSSIEYLQRLPITRLVITKKLAAIGLQPQKRHLVGGTLTSSSQLNRRAFLVYSVKPGNHHRHPPPTGDSPSSWQQWIFRIITTVIVPFFSRKWSNLLKFKDEVDTVVEETEKILDYVEEVAETVDKVAKEVADHLPDGGKWRNAALFVEDVAEEVAREAQLVEDFLHNVEEVEQEVELLGESVKDQTKNFHQDPNSSTQKIH